MITNIRSRSKKIITSVKVHTVIIDDSDEEVEPAQKIETKTEVHNNLDCQTCYYTFSQDFPHFKCKNDNYFGGNCGATLCQLCFTQWAKNRASGDNSGYTQLKCWRCKADIDLETIKHIFQPQDFIEYDNALTRFYLEKEKNIIYCPGKDCPNAFIKPKIKKTKRQCRKSKCDNCETNFCCLCGELYTTEHTKMKCGAYKKWQTENDDNVKSMNKWKKAKTNEVKNCPKCKRTVERSSGCDDMKCTNCDTRFCWRCLHVKTEYSCANCAKSIRIL